MVRHRSEIGVTIPSGVVGGFLRLSADEAVSALGSMFDDVVPMRVQFELDYVEELAGRLSPLSGSFALTPADVTLPVPPYVFVFNASLLAPGWLYNLTFTAYFAEQPPVVAARSFRLPPLPSTHSATQMTLLPNPVSSFPQRFLLICPEWYSYNIKVHTTHLPSSPH